MCVQTPCTSSGSSVAPMRARLNERARARERAGRMPLPCARADGRLPEIVLSQWCVGECWCAVWSSGRHWCVTCRARAPTGERASEEARASGRGGESVRGGESERARRRGGESDESDESDESERRRGCEEVRARRARGVKREPNGREPTTARRVPEAPREARECKRRASVLGVFTSSSAGVLARRVGVL